MLGGDHQVIIGAAKCAVRGEWETDHPGLTLVCANEGITRYKWCDL